MSWSRVLLALLPKPKLPTSTSSEARDAVLAAAPPVQPAPPGLPGGTQNIGGVTRWLEDLQRASGAIQRAGLASGANAAANSGLRAVWDSRTLHVAPRGNRPMGGIPDAMESGMAAEFERRAR